MEEILDAVRHWLAAKDEYDSLMTDEDYLLGNDPGREKSQRLFKKVEYHEIVVREAVEAYDAREAAERLVAEAESK